MENDSNKMANQFIELWQENFAKTMQDPEIMLSLTKAMGFMQQFYGQANQHQSAPSTFTFSSGAGPDELQREQLLGRISELEERIAKLERVGSGKRGKKKTS